MKDGSTSKWMRRIQIRTSFSGEREGSKPSARLYTRSFALVTASTALFTQPPAALCVFIYIEYSFGIIFNLRCSAVRSGAQWRWNYVSLRGKISPVQVALGARQRIKNLISWKFACRFWICVRGRLRHFTVARENGKAPTLSLSLARRRIMKVPRIPVYMRSRGRLSSLEISVSPLGYTSICLPLAHPSPGTFRDILHIPDLLGGKLWALYPTADYRLPTTFPLLADLGSGILFKHGKSRMRSDRPSERVVKRRLRLE